MQFYKYVSLYMTLGIVSISLLCAESQTSILTTGSQPPEERDFLSISNTPIDNKEQQFQHKKQRLRKVTIKGVHVIIDLSDNSSPITKAILDGENDQPTSLKELSIDALYVTIKGKVWLPGTHVRINSYELAFDDSLGDAQIITTPLSYPTPSETQETSLAKYLKENPHQYDEWKCRETLIDMVYEINYRYINISLTKRDGAPLPYPPHSSTNSKEKGKIKRQYFINREKIGSFAIEKMQFSSTSEVDNTLSMLAYSLKNVEAQKNQVLKKKGKPNKKEPLFSKLYLPSAQNEIILDPKWPKTIQVAKPGTQGLQAGNIHVSTKRFIASSTIPRFILKGGQGQHSGAVSSPLPQTNILDQKPSAVEYIAKEKGVPVYDPQPGKPLYTYKDIPVLLPSLFRKETLEDIPLANIKGTPLTNKWILQGHSGIRPAQGGKGGNPGNLTAYSEQEIDWAEITDSSAGESGMASTENYGSPAIINEWYELTPLSPNEKASTSATVYEFKGIPAQTDSGWEQNIAPFRFQLEHIKVSSGKTAHRSSQTKRTNEKGLLRKGTPPRIDITTLDLLLAWMREHFLSGYYDEASKVGFILFDQLQHISNPDPIMQSRITELSLMMRYLATERDYFGNKPGWVPAGSLDILLRGYKQTLDKAVNAIVTTSYLTSAVQHKESKTQRKRSMLKHFDAQSDILQNETDHLKTLLSEIDDEMKVQRGNIGRMFKSFKKAEEKIVSKTKDKEQLRHEILRTTASIAKFTENFAGVSADAFSEMGASVLGTEINVVGPALGYGLDIANSTVSALAESISYDLKKQPRVPEGEVAAQFEKLLENDSIKTAQRKLQEIDLRSISWKELLQKLDDITPPLAAASTRSFQQQIKSTLERTEEGRRLYDTMFTDRDPYAGFENGTLKVIAAVIEGLDFVEEAKNEVVKTTGEIGHLHQTSLINPRLPKALDKFETRASKAKFSELYALMNYQFTFRGILESKRNQAELLLKNSEARLKNAKESIRLLENDSSQSPDMAINASSILQSLHTIRKEAEDRLLYQKYCLIQAYHYRILEPCALTNPLTGRKQTIPVSRLKIAQQTDALLQSVFKPEQIDPRLKRTLSEEWSEYLNGTKALTPSSLNEVIKQMKTIHEQELVRIVEAIKNEMLKRARTSIEPRRVELTTSELNTLNTQGILEIDLDERDILFSKEQNARIISVHFKEPGTTNDEPIFGAIQWPEESEKQASSMTLRVTCEAGEFGTIRWGNNHYQFQHAKHENTSDIIASFSYNPITQTVHNAETLKSDSAFLMDLFDIPVKQHELPKLRAYKAARTKLTIRKETSNGNISVIPIEKLVLWIKIASNTSG